MTKDDNRYCTGCDYFSCANGRDHMLDSCCMYIVHKKHRRPDPGGVGCRLHTKKGEKMAERKWSMETAARLLQYGVSGKTVAETVGTQPSEISRHKDTLMSMVVEPITAQEVERLIKQREPELQPAPLPPQNIEATQTAPVVKETIPQSPAVTAPVTQGSPKPDIQVDISIGKGRVHLEAETPRQLVTLVNMLATMIETNED